MQPRGGGEHGFKGGSFDLVEEGKGLIGPLTRAFSENGKSVSKVEIQRERWPIESIMCECYTDAYCSHGEIRDRVQGARAYLLQLEKD